MRRGFVAVLAAVAGALAAVGPAAAAPATHPAPSAGFVTRTGSTLKLDGKPFRFGGTNNYYLFYSNRAMVDDVFTADSAGAVTFTPLAGFAGGAVAS
jgi:mannan endo-1,4-beta-mannosidase